MREILFRGKRVDNGLWIEGDLLTDMKGHPTHIRVKEQGGKFGAAVVRANTFAVLPETVGQWTGLYDKRKARIWEGDVLGNDAGAKPMHVVFDRGSFTLSGLSILADWTVWLEVIGNIHDTPSLLNDKT